MFYWQQIIQNKKKWLTWKHLQKGQAMSLLNFSGLISKQTEDTYEEFKVDIFYNTLNKKNI